jgi:hypothetical protein
MVLLDVTPHTLGIMVVGGYFEELIPQNTTVPTGALQDLHHRPRQPDGREDPRHAGREQARRGERAARRVHPHRPAPRARGQVEIEVTFEINADGIVSVHAKDSRPARSSRSRSPRPSGLTKEELDQHDGPTPRTYAVARRDDEEPRRPSRRPRRSSPRSRSSCRRSRRWWPARTSAATPSRRPAERAPARHALERVDRLAPSRQRALPALSRAPSRSRGGDERSLRPR